MTEACWLQCSATTILARRAACRDTLRGMRDVERVRIDVAAVKFEQDRAHITYQAGAIVG